ncbi:hypothetical protein CHLRE_14g610550v5 [Chlamydomonas reinhardtii]|uniref:BTB domain-containing protein n=1 Tax=Chlamydomonas reinhardtii TaxID=3055 RepID=A0A2K3CX69_CHLRE|nr:uncharacterized protein CHLRE_14g610550v5 [Chlamydomonas reinhardtii]PNW72887.1 hypothetical protein CHLRE_14g610550v5 [Chlamydomonas reinhardtii]
MQYLQNVAGCKLPLGNNLDDVFLRLDPSNEQRVQALVCDAVLRPLLGTDARWGFSLGDPIDLFWAGGSGAGPRRCFNSERRDFNDFCWDPWSAALYFVCGKAVLKLLGDEVELVAGSILEEGEADGEGPAARFYWPHTLVSDGAGSLLVVDGGNLRRIRRLQLPASWQWAGITAAATGGTAAGPRMPAGTAAAAGGAVAAASAVTVTTLLTGVPDYLYSASRVSSQPQPQEQQGPAAGDGQGASSCNGSSIGGGGGAGGGWVVYAIKDGFYRLPLPLPPPQSVLPAPAPATAAAAASGGAATPLALQRLELTDAGPGARPELEFGDLQGNAQAVDAEGSIYVVYSDRLCRVSPGGRVETLVTGLLECASCHAVLPNGFLALGAPDSLILLDLGLQPLLPQMPVTAAAPAVAAPPPPRSLPADLGALLDAQPDGTADLTVRVSERRFHCHRGILSARCDYFRQRLVGDGFADARAAELELPDADADAFALLLRWLYTGSATVAVDQACGVAELADRLLLPELLGVALAVVAESVSAATVIDKLLWAAGCCETRGEGFGGLLAQLKAWYVQHHEQVAAEAGAGRKRLASEAPDLMIELMDAVAVWCTDAGVKRARRS